jgi:AcrR family transcriptional regulator
MTASSYEAALAALQNQLEEWNWEGQTAARQNILGAFLELAIANGFNSVSMRTIATAVHIKPPSLYSHFPGGRNEIVAESLRWHFHRFGVALLEAVSPTGSADEFWDAMVRLHFTRQVRLPESNLWDLLVATDRMAGVLPKQVRAEVDNWIELHENMYVACAKDLGVTEAEDRVKVVITLLEGATRWASPECDDDELDRLTDQAITITRTLLKADF